MTIIFLKPFIVPYIHSSACSSIARDLCCRCPRETNQSNVFRPCSNTDTSCTSSPRQIIWCISFRRFDLFHQHLLKSLYLSQDLIRTHLLGTWLLLPFDLAREPQKWLIGHFRQWYLLCGFNGWSVDLETIYTAGLFNKADELVIY